MKTLLGIVIVGLCPLMVRAQTGAGSGSATADANAKEVAAILADRCVSCHGPEQRKGGLDLSRRATALSGGESGAVIVPGQPDLSLLVEKVTEGEMPPKGALATKQVAAVRAWVKAGAPFANEPLAPRRAGADWWSLRPIRLVTPPHSDGPDADWKENPIDAFILAGLKAKGLRPAPPAGRADLIRRLSFDLIGLPPRPEAVDAFVADPDPGAYEALVDRLLASPQYGERWGRHWLDVVRFGESQGYETNLPRPAAWPYRDYVIRAFNRDTPFPRFVFEQLAGDTLLGDAGSLGSPIYELGDRAPDTTADWLTQAATGFLVGGAHDIVGNQTIEGMLQQRADDLDDMITATGTTFLGLTIQCARCHDHKFDPITQKDYYGLQAIFAGVNHAEREVAAPGFEGRRRAAPALAVELARIEERLDAREPLARPDRVSADRPMVNPRRNVDRFAPVRARMVRLAIVATGDRIEPCLDEVEVYTAASAGGPPPRNVALVAAGGKASASSEYMNSPLHKIAHLNDGLHGNSRSWISRVPGKGSVTLAWQEPALIDRVVWGRDREEVYRDRLATEYVVETALEPGRWQVVASSLDRARYDPNAAARPTGSNTALPPEEAREQAGLVARQARLRARLAELGRTVTVYAGTFNQPGPTYLLVRGDPARKGPEAGPSGVAAVAPLLVVDPRLPEAQRRAALARWIADPANPLPARVMVNRLWQYHFGQGLVATPSDFGASGAPPSHPELLDWLASAYIAGGWRQKPIHRLIVTSAAYRQSGRPDEKARGVDRENRLLWRMSPRRLEAEAVRDAILATSGRLDCRMGGPGYNIWEKNTNYVAVYKPRAELGPDDFRRMVYQFKPRSQPDPTFGAFDCPNAALVAPRRNVSTTALQALNLLNSRFVIQQAAFFAERLKAEAGRDPARQAELGFRLAFGRPPAPTERTASAALIGSHGAAPFCRALYNANEFVYVP
jgi:mono/diheme cytochrome c family protein